MRSERSDSFPGSSDADGGRYDLEASNDEDEEEGED
jgi:hypothetical protein